MKRIYMILAAVLISAASFAQSITLLHLNDTHSHMDPEKSGKHAGKGGVIEQAAYIDSVRCADGKRNVLLLHAGDFSQGTSRTSMHLPYGHWSLMNLINVWNSAFKKKWPPSSDNCRNCNADFYFRQRIRKKFRNSPA